MQRTELIELLEIEFSHSYGTGLETRLTWNFAVCLEEQSEMLSHDDKSSLRKYQKEMRVVIDNAVTDGERLCNFVNHRLLASVPWDTLAFALEPTGRPADLVEFYREITAVGLTGRLVSAGTSIAESVAIDDPAFRKEFTGLLTRLHRNSTPHYR